MDATEKWARMRNPKFIEDYGLSVNFNELDELSRADVLRWIGTPPVPFMSTATTRASALDAIVPMYYGAQNDAALEFETGL